MLIPISSFNSLIIPSKLVSPLTTNPVVGSHFPPLYLSNFLRVNNIFPSLFIIQHVTEIIYSPFSNEVPLFLSIILPVLSFFYYKHLQIHSYTSSPFYYI